MSLNVRDYLTPAAIAARWTEPASNKADYVGLSLFPRRKKAGLDLRWFKGSGGLPVSLMPSTFDAKATFRDRPGFKMLETEMPFFREGFHISERDRQELLRAKDSNDPYAVEILNRLFEDADNLIAGADVVAERMIMQLLFCASGAPAISFAANGVAYAYNYDPNGTWNSNNYFALTSPKLWTTPSTSDPIADLRTAQDAIFAATGTKPTVAMMNSVTFGAMCQSAAIIARFVNRMGVNSSVLSPKDVKQIVKDELDIRVIVYGKQYKNESGTTAKFVPDYYVSLVPDGDLGKTWMGTTPEEADLLGKVSDVKCAIVNTGVAVTQIVEPHPVNVNIFASEIVLPSWERMDECALLKVG